MGGEQGPAQLGQVNQLERHVGAGASLGAQFRRGRCRKLRQETQVINKIEPT